MPESTDTTPLRAKTVEMLDGRCACCMTVLQTGGCMNCQCPNYALRSRVISFRPVVTTRTYRIMNGEVFEVLPGLPPWLEHETGNTT